MKKTYMQPAICEVLLKEPMMELNGVSVFNKNDEEGQHNVTIGIDGEGNMEDEARSKKSFWDDDYED